MRRRPRRVSRHRKPLRLPVRPRLMSLCRSARQVLQRRTRRRSAVRSHGPPVTRHAPAVQRAPERASRTARAPEQTRGPAEVQHSAPSQAPAAQRAQVDGLRQQQERELRSQAGRVAPAHLNELRAQQRQQLEQLQTQQNQARQRELTGRSNQPASNQPSMGQNAARVAPQVAARIAPDAARQGRFAAAFAPRSALASAEAFPNWTAWRLRRRAAFVPWSGALFWPYVYTDMFYYAFWPGAYDEGYWAYAYDDLLDGAYWAYGDPYAAYAYVGPNPDTAGFTGGRVRTRAASGRDVAAACEQSANVADWPFGQIEAAIAPTPEQQQLLNNLKSAANQAANMLRTSCPSSFPLTPPGRLQAMTARLDATLRAVDLVRPPLARFYDSLSDEQKARFNAIGPEPGHEGVRAAGRSQAEAEGACGKAKPGLIDLPIGQIEAVVGPTGAQAQALDRLREASSQAVGILQSACPQVTAQTPVGRLDVMHDRLAAMLNAAKTLQPVLNDFYASLNNEQKAAFNTLGREARRPG
jgi:LTXXQ motif family protein